jgi:hypothetical protein
MEGRWSTDGVIDCGESLATDYLCSGYSASWGLLKCERHGCVWTVRWSLLAVLVWSGLSLGEWQAPLYPYLLWFLVVTLTLDGIMVYAGAGHVHVERCAL